MKQWSQNSTWLFLEFRVRGYQLFSCLLEDRKWGWTDREEDGKLHYPHLQASSRKPPWKRLFFFWKINTTLSWSCKPFSWPTMLTRCSIHWGILSVQRRPHHTSHFTGRNKCLNQSMQSGSWGTWREENTLLSTPRVLCFPPVPKHIQPPTINIALIDELLYNVHLNLNILFKIDKHWQTFRISEIS